MMNCFVDDQQKGNWNHRSASRFNVYTPKRQLYFFPTLLKILALNHIKHLWKIMLKLFHGHNGFWIISSPNLFTLKTHQTNQPDVLKPLSNHFIFTYFLFYLLTKMLMFIICLCCCCCYCYCILPSTFGTKYISSYILDVPTIISRGIYIK